MEHLGSELDKVSEDAHQVLRQAKDANVWVTGGGLIAQQASIVDPDGLVRLGDFPEKKPVIGGFVIVDVKSRDDALEWARRFAKACRCPQEVRELLHDPEV